MEEARELHVCDELRERGLDPTDEEAAIAARIATLRSELAELERQLVLARPRDGGTAVPPLASPGGSG